MAASRGDESRLATVRAQAEAFRGARDELMRRAIDQVNKDLAAMERALEESVMYALERNSVTDVAIAFTPVGTKTPNRGAIYAIKRKYSDTDEPIQRDLPFEWLSREVSTINGDITLYDLHAELEDFGPDNINGTFTWIREGGKFLPVIDPDSEPYPTTKWYQLALQKFLAVHPYPGGD